MGCSDDATDGTDYHARGQESQDGQCSAITGEVEAGPPAGGGNREVVVLILPILHEDRGLGWVVTCWRVWDGIVLQVCLMRIGSGDREPCGAFCCAGRLGEHMLAQRPAQFVRLLGFQVKPWGSPEAGRALR